MWYARIGYHVTLSVHLITPLKCYHPVFTPNRNPNPNFKDVETAGTATTDDNRNKTPIRPSNASVMEEVRFECIGFAYHLTATEMCVD